MISEETLFDLLSEEQRSEVTNAYQAKLMKAVSDMDIKIQLDDNDLEYVKGWIMDSIFDQVKDDKVVAGVVMGKIRSAFVEGD